MPLLLGTGILAVLYRKQFTYKITLSESYVLGIIACIGLMQVVHVVGLFGDVSLTKVGFIVGVLLAVAVLPALAGVISHWKKQKERFFRLDKQEKTMLPFLFLVLFFLQFLLIYCMKPVVTQGDITLETVQSFLAQDGIYRVMPLTGNVSETGMPLRYTILCLPTLYSILCQVFDMEPELLVCHMIPALVLAASYFGYYHLSGILFGEKALKKRYLFLVIVACFFLFMDRGVSSNGYSALHGGYLGVSVRNLVLVPYVFSSALEKRWWKAVLCVLAEACIVWTFWGFGVCAAVLAGMLIVTLLDEKCPAVHKLMQIFREKEEVS